MVSHFVNPMISFIGMICIFQVLGGVNHFSILSERLHFKHLANELFKRNSTKMTIDINMIIFSEFMLTL